MKKRIFVIIMCIGIILCTSCQYLPYEHKTPMAYDETCWVSEEPSIWFENSLKNTDRYLHGKAMTANGEINIAVDFAAFQPKIYIYTYEWEESVNDLGEIETKAKLNECVLSGECEYSKEYCSVKLEKDELFDGKYETIALWSEPIE